MDDHFNRLFLIIPPLASLIPCMTTKASLLILSISVFNLATSSRVIKVYTMSVSFKGSPFLAYPFFPWYNVHPIPNFSVIANLISSDLSDMMVTPTYSSTPVLTPIVHAYYF